MRPDANGNALGGVRTPYLDVPTGSFHASVGVGFCGPLNGWKSQFTEEGLRELYRNHGGYVSRVARRSNELVQQGWLLPEDAETIKTQAAESDVPAEAPVP